MNDRSSLHVFLLFAHALKGSKPFDAKGVFELLRGIGEDAEILMDGHMRAAIEASLTAAGSQEAHATAVARYALERVVIEIEDRLAAGAA